MLEHIKILSLAIENSIHAIILTQMHGYDIPTSSTDGIELGKCKTKLTVTVFRESCGSYRIISVSD